MLVSSFDIRPINVAMVNAMCTEHHGYGSAGNSATYAFGVIEGSTLVAAYAWQPPPPGASESACPEAPQGVLSLSRMVAVPKEERRLKHVSKPLRVQMKKLIDRTRWPVLVTYSDEGEGHTGYVYQCSGWEPTHREEHPFFVDAEGRRQSSYSNGHHGGRDLVRRGTTWLQRWEHWIVERGKAAEWMTDHGWRRVPIPGKVWRSGNQAHTYKREVSGGLFDGIE